MKKVDYKFIIIMAVILAIVTIVAVVILLAQPL